MRQTREDFTDLLFDFAFGVLSLGLVVAGAEIDGRALAQAVFVLRGEADVVKIEIFFTGSRRFALAVDIVGADRQVAVADRNDRADVEAVALGAFVVAASATSRRVSKSPRSRPKSSSSMPRPVTAAELDALEVLAHQEGLGKAAVVVAAR